MNKNDKEELKQKIREEIKTQKHLIDSFIKTSNTVSPDNAIGRLTRMEAISSKGISEASLNASRAKLVKLKKPLRKIDFPDFGICVNCSTVIPYKRIILIPESQMCVGCAEQPLLKNGYKF